MTTIELGDRVIDNITKFQGIVTAIATYLHGVTRVQITAEEVNSEGHTVEGWFDEPGVGVVMKGAAS